MTGNNAPTGTLALLATNTDLPSHRGWSSWNFLWDASFGDTVTLRINEEIKGGYGESHEWYSKEYAGAYKPYLEITTSPATSLHPSDFNADGKPDLVWQHQATGRIGVWFMNGGTQSGASFFTPGQIDTGWKIVAP